MERLPQELFIPIMDGSLPLHWASPWPGPTVSRLATLRALERVSKSWKIRIRNTSTLWSTLSSSDPLPLVEEALELSGNSGLKTYVKGVPFDANTPNFMQAARNHVRQYLHLLAPHCERFVLVQWELLRRQIPDHLPNTSAPTLTTLSLTVMDTYNADELPEFDLFQGGVPNLRHLKVTACKLQWPRQAYSNLRSLELAWACRIGQMRHQDIREILDSASATLETLSIHADVDDGDSDDDTPAEEYRKHVSRAAEPPVKLPKLQCVKLEFLSPQAWDMLSLFDAQTCFSFTIYSWPVETASTEPLEIHGIDIHSPIWRATIQSLYARHLVAYISTVPQERLLCSFYLTGRNWFAGKRYYQIRSRDSEAAGFVMEKASGWREFPWLQKHLPTGFLDEQGLDIHFSGTWWFDELDNSGADFFPMLKYASSLTVSDVPDEEGTAATLGVLWRLDGDDGASEFAFSNVTNLTISCDNPVRPFNILEMVKVRYGITEPTAMPGPAKSTARFSRLDIGVVEQESEDELDELTRILGPDVLVYVTAES